MKSSLTNKLYEMLKNRNVWLHGSEIEDYGHSLGYMASNVGRRLRDLRKCGSVISELRTHNGQKTAWWKINSETNQSKAVDDKKGRHRVFQVDKEQGRKMYEVRDCKQSHLFPLLG